MSNLSGENKDDLPYVPQGISPRVLNEFTEKKKRNFFVGLWIAYNKSLEKNPILTKSVTSAIISMLSDIFAQKVIQKQPLNLARPIKFGIWGFFFIAPLNHNYYKLLDSQVSAKKLKGTSAVIGKLLVDQLLYAPLILSLFFIVMNILNMTPFNIKRQIKRDLLNTLKSNWKIWPVAQFINFYFVPVQLRVLFGNVIAFGWNAYLSKRFLKNK